MGSSPVSQPRPPIIDVAPILISIVALIVSISTCHTSNSSSDTRQSASAERLIAEAIALLEANNRPTDLLPDLVDLGHAQARLTEAVALVGESSDTYYAWGLLHYWEKELEKAKTMLGRAIDMDGKHNNSILLLSRIHRENGDADQSVIAVYDLTQRDQELPSSMIELVRIYLDKFRNTQSVDDRIRLQSGVEALEKMISDGEVVDTYDLAIVMSQAHRALSNFEEAKGFAANASQEFSNSVEPIIEYARAEEVTDRISAIARLEKALEDHPDELQVYELLARLYVLGCDNRSLHQLDTIANLRMQLLAMEVIDRYWMLLSSTCR